MSYFIIDGTNVAVGQMSGGRNVCGRNVCGTYVCRTKVAPPDLNNCFQQIEKLWSTLGGRPSEAVELAWEQLQLCQRHDFHAGRADHYQFSRSLSTCLQI
jgi:hypothetical protein